MSKVAAIRRPQGTPSRADDNTGGDWRSRCDRAHDLAVYGNKDAAAWCLTQVCQTAHAGIG
jgi:hypothetical protein